MRTLDPQSIRDDFLAAVGDVSSTFSAAEASSIALGGKKLIAEYSFLSVAILFEGYVSDLFIAYINRDSSVFAKFLVGRMSINTTDEHAARASSLATIAIGKRLTAAEIRSVLDSRDYNITFPTVDKMKEGAGRWLAVPQKNHFTSISPSHAACILATKAIRNFLAHRSAASKSEMQTALISGDLKAEMQRGQNAIRDVGSYLRSHPTPQLPMRLEQYLAELKQIAQALCP